VADRGRPGLFVVGDTLFSANELVLGIEPFPSLADAVYLPGYPVLAAGLALLALRRSTARDRAGLTDAAIIAIGFGATTSRSPSSPAPGRCCSATRRRPGSSTPRPPSPPRSRGCGS
jgi:hypothetical protein